MGFFDLFVRLISVKQKGNHLLWQDLSAQENGHEETRNDELNKKGKRPGSGCVQVIDPDQVQALIMQSNDAGGDTIEVPIQ